MTIATSGPGKAARDRRARLHPGSARRRRAARRTLRPSGRGTGCCHPRANCRSAVVGPRAAPARESESVRPCDAVAGTSGARGGRMARCERQAPAPQPTPGSRRGDRDPPVCPRQAAWSRPSIVQRRERCWYVSARRSVRRVHLEQRAGPGDRRVCGPLVADRDQPRDREAVLAPRDLTRVPLNQSVRTWTLTGATRTIAMVMTPSLGGSSPPGGTPMRTSVRIWSDTRPNGCSMSRARVERVAPRPYSLLSPPRRSSAEVVVPRLVRLVRGWSASGWSSPSSTESGTGGESPDAGAGAPPRHAGARPPSWDPARRARAGPPARGAHVSSTGAVLAPNAVEGLPGLVARGSSDSNIPSCARSRKLDAVTPTSRMR